jgi:adenylosuccinate synthase
MDILEEDRLGDAKFGSTQTRHRPVYADKYMKKSFRMGDLLHMEDVKRRLPAIVE